MTKTKTGDYAIRVQRMPYTLSESEKRDMGDLFARVMAPLSFRAKPEFLPALYETPLLIRAHSRSGQLAAFGNVRIRESGGKTVRHVLAVYVDPAHRDHGLSVRVVATALLQEAIRNYCCVFEPLYVTGSAVNPIVYASLARRMDVWPDLVGGEEAPADIVAIAADSATRYYPVRGEHAFQVGVTAGVAEIRETGVTQMTGDAEFDRRFFEIARPADLKLLLFVGRIRFRHVVQASVELAQPVLRRVVATLRRAARPEVGIEEVHESGGARI
jgi:hypothetical protein